MTQFQAHTVEEHTSAVGNYFFDGKLASATQIKTSNLRKLFYGISGQLTFIDQIFESVWDGVSIITTKNLDYILAWEKAVGIPDLIFKETTSLSIEARRQQVLIKLRGLGVLTKEDFEALGSILGYTIIVTAGNDYPIVFPITFPLVFCSSLKSARFVMMINLPANLTTEYVFPLTFPLMLSGGTGSVVENLFNSLKPANVRLIFNYVL